MNSTHSSPTRDRAGIEVLICTHNRVELLARTVDYLNRAEKPSRLGLRIKVAVNACTDGTVDFLEDYRKRTATERLTPISWSIVETPGKSHALNEAIPQLTAEVIAFVDDDHRVAETYFTAIETAIDKYPDCSLLCGRILPDWTGDEPAWVHDTGPYRIFPLPIPRFEQGTEPFEVRNARFTPGGGNLVIRREVFARVGQFSSDLGPVGHDLGGGEDIEWVKRALAYGERLAYVPDIVQHHYVDQERLKLSYLLKKAYSRTLSSMNLRADIKGGGVPAFMYRKLLGYVFRALFCLNNDQRRYYLVRCTAALAEIRGFRTHRDDVANSNRNEQ